MKGFGCFEGLKVRTDFADFDWGSEMSVFRNITTFKNRCQNSGQEIKNFFQKIYHDVPSNCGENKASGVLLPGM